MNNKEPKDYSKIPPKSYQSTFQTYIREYSGPIKDIPIAQYLEESMGYSDYLSLYLDCLTTAREHDAYRKEAGWIITSEQVRYDNVVELCRQKLIGPFKVEA